MKKSFIVIYLMVALLVFQTAAAASEPPKVLPGSTFYFLKLLSEKIELFLTFNKAARIQKLETVAAERLAEAEAVAEEDSEAAKTALSRYADTVGNAASLAVENKDSEAVQKSLEVLKTNTLKHQEVLAGLEEKVPTQAKEAILNAESKSSEHIADVIEKLESKEAAEEYLNQVEEVQQVAREMQMSQATPVEQVTPAPMESSPAETPESAAPRELKILNTLKQIFNLKSLNPLNPPQEDEEGENKGNVPMPQAVPIQPGEPAPQN